MANINKIRLSGQTYNIEDVNATKTVELTQAQYDALVVKDPNTFYVITDAQGADLSNYYTKSETSGATEISTALASKQTTLTAGTGIDITDNVISATGGGGKAVSGGTNISITTGETADTINCTLPISVGGSFNNCLDLTRNTGNSLQGSGNVAFGSYVNVTNNGELGFGRYNMSNTTTASPYYNNPNKTLFSVGNGTALNERHNAFEIRQNGDIYLTKDGQDVKLQDQLGGGGSSYTAGDGIDITNDVISVTGKQDTLISGTNIKTINNESLLGSGNIVIQGGGTISIDQTVISGSTNAVAGGAVYDQLGGMKIVKLTESEYTALATKDDNTLYCVIPDPSN